jgi:6-pyruvoyltetrahydropterin/6-carboxytetrahydropterin synthase
MKHIIDKSFSFAYGHRVHNQRLDTQFTEGGNACLACRHLHGHEGLVKVFLEEIDTGVNIKNTGMVTDFKHLGWFKDFIDDVLDHKMILDLKDPLLKEECPYLLDDSGEFSMDFIFEMPEGYFLPDLQSLRKTLDKYIDKYNFDKEEAQAIFEKYEGLVFVDFVPTSENLAGWLLGIAQKKMQNLENIRVKAIEYNETPKSHCRVEA